MAAAHRCICMNSQCVDVVFVLALSIAWTKDTLLFWGLVCDVVLGFRLAQKDVQQNGWLLDGYPRSPSQADAIEKEDIRPDLFLLVEVRGGGGGRSRGKWGGRGAEGVGGIGAAY